MNTTNPTCHSAMNCRHQNPRCVCSECRAFDQGITLHLQSLPTESFIMTAIDTETSERFTYSYHQGVLSKLPAAAPSPRQTPEQQSGMKRSVRTLLHGLVMERA